MKTNRLGFFFVVILLSVAYTFLCDTLYSNTGEEKYLIYARQVGGQLAYFVFGMVMYELLNWVLKYKITIFCIGVVATIISYLVPAMAFLIEPFSVAMLIISAVFMGNWGQWLKSVDISYELYLVHFPVIQIIVNYGIVDSLGFFPTMLLAIFASVAVSFLCWQLVGKRFLRRGPRRTIVSKPDGQR